MIINSLAHGFSLALGLILPLGAQNTFIINQGASHQRYLRVMPAVITAGLCDTFLIILATTGVSKVVLLYPPIKIIMFVGAILFLAYLGWNMWKVQPNQEQNKIDNQYSIKFQVITATTLSLLNPHAIADTVATIGTSALAYDDLQQRFYFILACIVVSWIWFFTLSIFGKMLSKNKIYSIYQNKVSALMIWSSCVIILYSLVSLS